VQGIAVYPRAEVSAEAGTGVLGSLEPGLEIGVAVGDPLSRRGKSLRASSMRLTAADNAVVKHQLSLCPGCGYRTLGQPDMYELCPTIAGDLSSSQFSSRLPLFATVCPAARSP